MKEFNLSDEMKVMNAGHCFTKEDVKEFIRMIEAIMMNDKLSRREKIERLHKRAGEELI